MRESERGREPGSGSGADAGCQRRVHRLDEATVARIAAGEVITRPADAVVELLENALDAGAASVEVSVENAGLDSIRVADDGRGMVREDARLAVERHATSKLDGDLQRIETLGFRGEALPAIAAAGRLELLTRPGGAEAGTRVVVDGDDVSVERAGRGVGTTAVVTDLFAEVPARREALAGPAREFQRVSDALTRYALVRPDVRFRLAHDGRQVLSTPGSGDPVDALLAAYGREVAGRAHAVAAERETDAGSVAVEGVAVAPAVTRASPGHVHLAVNGRAVDDATLREAVLAGYDRLLPGDRYPVAAVDVSVPPGSVDVNVHPRKREVRFAGVGAVAGVVEAGVREAFADDDLARDLDADLEGAIEPARSRFEDVDVIGQYRGLYLLCEADEDLLVVDQHAAHERITYERLRAQVDGGIDSVTVDPPATVALSPPQRAALEAEREAVAALGFRVERFGGDTYRVTGLPAPLGRAGADGTALSDVLDAFVAGDDPEDPRGALLAEAACHPALKAGDDLSRTEAADLIADLGACEQPYACPHGRPTVLRVDEATLAKGFERPATRLG